MDQFSYEVNGKHILVYRSIYEPLNSNMFTILSNNEAIVFDPNIDNDLLALFQKKRINKAHILLTHGHYDHISGVEWLKENIKATVYCHVKCAERLANSKSRSHDWLHWSWLQKIKKMEVIVIRTL